MNYHIVFISVLLAFAIPPIPSGQAYGGNNNTGQITVRPKALEFIRVSEDKTGFVCATSGRPFIVWGVNYDHDVSGRLLEDYWKDEWPAVVGDFKEMKELGANVVRIHLQLAKFMTTPEKPDKSSLKQLAMLVQLAAKTGLYLDITGLGCYHKKDVPDWYDTLDEASRWDVQARFWEAVAGVCAESPAVFCYDLMNEPILPGEKEKETNWLTGELDGMYFVQRISLDLEGRRRELVAAAWVDRLAAAIRKNDKRHMITLGIIPWKYEFPQSDLIFYSKEASENLDFTSVHFYPKKGDIDNTLKALKAYDIGKPLVIEEIFPLNCSQNEIDSFIEGSRGFTDGWISFYWGRSIEDYSHKDLELNDAIIKTWFEYFRAKGHYILGTGKAVK